MHSTAYWKLDWIVGWMWEFSPGKQSFREKQKAKHKQKRKKACWRWHLLRSDVYLVDVDSSCAGPSKGRGECEEGDGEDVVAAGVTDGREENCRQHQTCGEMSWVLKRLSTSRFFRSISFVWFLLPRLAWDPKRRLHQYKYVEIFSASQTSEREVNSHI